MRVTPRASQFNKPPVGFSVGQPKRSATLSHEPLSCEPGMVPRPVMKRSVREHPADEREQTSIRERNPRELHGRNDDANRASEKPVRAEETDADPRDEPQRDNNGVPSS